MTRYLSLADSALHAPAAGFEGQDFYPDIVDEAWLADWLRSRVHFG